MGLFPCEVYFSLSHFPYNHYSIIIPVLEGFKEKLCPLSCFYLQPFFSFWPAVSYLLDFFQYLAVLLVLMIFFPLSFNFEDAVGILDLVYSILFTWPNHCIISFVTLKKNSHDIFPKIYF